MKKYKRISSAFIADGHMSSLRKDDDVSESLDKKLADFLKTEKVKSYRILNAETVLVPKQDFCVHYNLVCLHLEYEL